MKEMKDQEKLVPLLRQAATHWLALGHQDIFGCDDYTDDLGNFCNRVAGSLVKGTLSEEDAERIWTIFAPTCQWDDSVGNVELGNQIFELVNKLYGKRVREEG